MNSGEYSLAKLTKRDFIKSDLPTMSDHEALEDLRSKIIASMKPNQTKENAGKRVTAPSDGNSAGGKRPRISELPKGPRNGSNTYASPNGTSRVNEPRTQSRYGGAMGHHDGRRSTSRFNNHDRAFTGQSVNMYGSGGSYQEPNNEHLSATSNYQRPGNSFLQGVAPIDQRRRMRPTRWDVTPKGFEKVPAERAKLSGLFPQPGQPQELDRYKLERVAIHGGTKSRRTRILFDDATSNNLTISRMTCRLVIEFPVGKNWNERELERFLTKFVKSLGEQYEMKKISSESNFALIEFNSPECTTLVFASRLYIIREAKLENATWKRPNEYVQQLDHPDRLCAPDIIALQSLNDEEEIEKMLNENEIKFNSCQPIFLTENGGSKLFTGCAVVELSEIDEDKLNNLKNVSWFKPNYSKLSQNSSAINFQTLPLLVAEAKRPNSKVIKIFNCVDPLDLKYVPFQEEIEETLREMLNDVEIIWMNKPNVNYRLNFENIGEDIGNIYVKFTTTEASEKAMADLPGKKINGRTMLCSYFDEDDFNLIRYN